MSEKKSTPDSKKNQFRLFRGWIRKKAPNWLLGLAIEAFLIIFSVLLALAVNEWRAEAQREDQLNIALDAIKSEMKRNIEELEQVSIHHSGIYDTLTYYRDQNKMPPSNIYLGGMFNPADLLSTAWETAVQTGVIEELSYQLILDLSKVYKEQKQYEELGNSITQESYSHIINLGPERFMGENYKNWTMVVRDFSAREQQLQIKLEEILNRL